MADKIKQAGLRRLGKRKRIVTRAQNLHTSIFELQDRAMKHPDPQVWELYSKHISPNEVVFARSIELFYEALLKVQEG